MIKERKKTLDNPKKGGCPEGAKQVGKKIKERVGNFRTMKYTMNHFSKTGAVNVECYLDNVNEMDKGNILRHFNRLWRDNGKKYLEGLGYSNIIFVPQIPESIWNLSTRTSKGYCKFDIQFNNRLLGKPLKDNSIYQIAMDTVIEMIKDSNLEIMNK